MDIIAVVGARPNFMKVAPLVPVLTRAGHRVRLAHTGQHYDDSMSNVFFRDLDIPEPDWFLGVGSGRHAVQTGTAMMLLEELLSAECPDAILVIGDVNSTLAAALAAVKIHIPIIHLEAGLRSFDMTMPEEVNRLVTDQVSALLLTPTVRACDNLRSEGVDPERIHFVGNIMAETLLRALPALSGKPRPIPGLEPGSYALATIHRPENTDSSERLASIASGLGGLNMPVVVPAHPRLEPLLAQAGVTASGTVSIVEPVGYLDMLALMREAAIVITDSGGIQEEACMLDVPCVTVRRNTERQETIDVGANRLCRPQCEEIIDAVSEALALPKGWPKPARWDDQVSERIAVALAGGVKPLPGTRP